MSSDEEIEAGFRGLADAVADAAKDFPLNEDARQISLWLRPKASRHPEMLGSVRRHVEAMLEAPEFKKHHERIREALGEALRHALSR